MHVLLLSAVPETVVEVHVAATRRPARELTPGSPRRTRQTAAA